MEGPAIRVDTLEEWREDVEGECDTPDSEELEEVGLQCDSEWAAPLTVEPHFHLPLLRELSLLSCRLEKVPRFVAGAGCGALQLTG